MTRTNTAPTGFDVMHQFLPASPLPIHLGIELVELRDGHARLHLPFRDHNVTMGSVVHGGAVAALVDTAAMAAAWAGADVPENLRGATVSLSVNYVAAADGVELTADARVVRRGRRLTSLQVEVTDPSGEIVATAMATYQMG